MTTISGWPPPGSFRKIQVLLGFAYFHCRFISKFSKVAKPLSSMLVGGSQGKCTGKFILTVEARRAFESLTHVFTTAPMLRHYDQELPLRLATDSCGFVIPAILSQLYIVEQAMGEAGPAGLETGSDESAPVRLRRGVLEDTRPLKSDGLAGVHGQQRDRQPQSMQERRVKKSQP